MLRAYAHGIVLDVHVFYRAAARSADQRAVCCDARFGEGDVLDNAFDMKYAKDTAYLRAVVNGDAFDIVPLAVEYASESV